MNIRSIETNLNKLQNDNLLKFLYDLIITNLYDVDSYEIGKIYNKGDLIYLERNNIHKIYQCIVEKSNNIFVDEEWDHILDVYPYEIRTVNNLKIREEVHIITEETVNGIITKLDFKQENSSFAIYKGKKRYAINYDFTVDDKSITFMRPFNVGDRLILEVRETIGLPDRLILLSSNGIKYEVGVIDNEVFIFESIHRTSKNEVYLKDISNGNKYKIYLIDEDLYYEITDINVVKTEAKVVGVDGIEYKLEIIDDELVFSIKE